MFPVSRGASMLGCLRGIAAGGGTGAVLTGNLLKHLLISCEQLEEDDFRSLPKASLARRLLAGLYDWLLVIAVLMVASVPFVAGTGEPVAAGNNLYRSFLAFIIVGFFCGFWYWGGQTVGMRAWRLRVVGVTRLQLSPAQALRRFGWACIGALALGAGYWWMLFDPAGCSWHDRMSGTRVVQLPKPQH